MQNSTLTYRLLSTARRGTFGSSLVVSGCGSSGGESDTSTSTTDSTDLSRSRWESLPSTQFSVTHKQFGVIDMQLTAIDSEIDIRQSEQFSVVLTGPVNPLFAEGTYELYNESLGYIDLYLQPGDNIGGQQNYRAIFNLVA